MQTIHHQNDGRDLNVLQIVAFDGAATLVLLAGGAIFGLSWSSAFLIAWGGGICATLGWAACIYTYRRGREIRTSQPEDAACEAHKRAQAIELWDEDRAAEIRDALLHAEGRASDGVFMDMDQRSTSSTVTCHSGKARRARR